MVYYTRTGTYITTISVPDGIWTHNLSLRRGAFYPVELQARGFVDVFYPNLIKNSYCLLPDKFVFFIYMKCKFAQHRGICPNFFSTDKHWVFILLIASSFVLFSLLFVLLNQTPSLNSSYATIKSDQPLNLNSTSSAKSAQDSTTSFSNTLPQIKKIFHDVYSGQITMAKNNRDVNFYTSKNISFYDESAFKSSTPA